MNAKKIMSDSTVQQVKDRLDIAEVLSGYMSLKKAGVNFKGLCPFHNEKTPSFVVTPSRQIWHCFGCGEGGDVFSFVQKFENLDFAQTLKMLAGKAGVVLPEYSPQDKQKESEKERLVRINSFAAKFYHQTLFTPQGKSALEYLKKRGLKKETLEKWQIGFAPNTFRALKEALEKKKVNLQDGILAGVLIKNEKGQIYDRFRGRITFPIFNSIGEAVGFSARILPELDDGKSGKYINSPETPVYSKSKVLFGFNFARNDIRKYDSVLVVEGQMDCISAHQAGFTNAVATSGTAMTGDQLTFLGRLTKNLKFCFDSDPAGLAATKKAVIGILGKDFNIKVVDLSGAKDPDEFIQKNRNGFEKAVNSARLFLDFYFDKLFQNAGELDAEKKKRLAQETLPLVRSLADPIEKEHYLQILAQKFGVVPNVLKQSIEKIKPEKFVSATPIEAKMEAHKPTIELEKLVLGGMLSQPEFLKKVIAEGQAEDFTIPEIRQIAEVFFRGEPLRPEVLKYTLANEAVSMVEFMQAEGQSTEAFEKDLTKAFLALRLNYIKQRQLEIQNRIQQAEKEKEPGAIHDLQKEFRDLSRLRLKYQV